MLNSYHFEFFYLSSCNFSLTSNYLNYYSTTSQYLVDTSHCTLEVHSKGVGLLNSAQIFHFKYKNV